MSANVYNRALVQMSQCYYPSRHEFHFSVTQRFIYYSFYSITEYIIYLIERVLEGTEVGAQWFYVMEETGVPGRNHRPWAEHYHPAKYRCWKTNPDRRGNKRGFYTCGGREPPARSGSGISPYAFGMLLTYHERLFKRVGLSSKVF